jgi:hypothetical protein
MRPASRFSSRRRRLIGAGLSVPAQATLVPWAMLGCSGGSGSASTTANSTAAAPVQTPDPGPSAQAVKGKAAALGFAFRTQRYNWMGDFIDLSKLPPLFSPFILWHDEAKGVVAPVQNGKPASRFVQLDPWGPHSTVMHVMAQGDRIIRYNPTHADVIFADDDLYTPGKWIVSVEGRRGECLISPYITWLPHPTLDSNGNPIPRAPWSIGVSVEGIVYAQYLLPQPYCIELGRVAIAKTEGILDLAFFPPNRKIFFVAVLSRAKQGRIIKIDRTKAIAAKPDAGIEDGKLWEQSDLVTGVGNITSLVACDDGTLYACDNTNGQLIKAYPSGGAIAGTPRPFFIRRTRDERLVVLSQDESLKLYGRDGTMLKVIRPAPPTSQPDRPISFGALDVDRLGTCGEVDRIMMFSSHMDNANGCLFLSGPDWSVQQPWGNMIGGASVRNVGSTQYAGYPMHYPWSCFFHIDQGAMQFQGFGNINPTLICPARPGDPPLEQWDHGRHNHGLGVLIQGTVAGKEGTKPSLTCQFDLDGWGGLGVHSDWLYSMKLPDGSPDFQRMVDWIHAGGLGSVRRDEIQGYDLWALLYFFAGGSQELVRQGQPLLDKLAAFFGGYSVIDHPVPAPNIPSASEYEPKVSAFVEGSTIKLRTLDAYGGALQHDPNLVARIVIDEGMTDQVIAGVLNAANAWEIAMPTVAAGQHILSCRIQSKSPGHIGEASVLIV